MAQDVTVMSRDLSVRGGALTQSLPPVLRQVIESGTISVEIPRERGGGIAQRERPDWTPPTLRPETIRLAQQACRELLDHLAGVDEDVCGRLIGKLRAHDWRHRAEPAPDPAMQEALSVDWIDDFVSFPQWAIEQACREWRRTMPYRPIISELRALCDAAVADDRRALRLLSRAIAARQERKAA